MPEMNPDIPATSSAKNTSTRNIAYYTGGGKEKMLKNKSTKKKSNINYIKKKTNTA